ncbi:MAG TPA: hypothetical protein VMI52_06650 [Acetobacteraceae bacterium]|nr:hypothetical protein [Acetobacteraceae bacterium]
MAVAATLLLPDSRGGPEAAEPPAELRPAFSIDPDKRAAWLERWQKNILAELRNRYCDSAMGEEIGWLISPILTGLFYGYVATGDARWIDHLVDWTDAWIGRGVTEPDGCTGWPKVGAAGTEVDNLDSFCADSLLGEAMALRPTVLAAAAILKAPALARRYGRRATDYLALARSMFEKWDRRGVWRSAGDGMISVVLPYGIEPKTRQWTAEDYDRSDLRLGFSHPDNKANLVALWLLAMTEATGDPSYRERAAAWFRLMKSRLHLQADGTFAIWNYWEPAGPWDYRASGRPKHWVGVHPKAGYYEIDVMAMVTAFRHGVVFTARDVERLIRTANATGRLWPALAPYDAAIRSRFEHALMPGGWEGLVLVPWYLALQMAPPAQTEL